MSPRDGVAVRSSSVQQCLEFCGSVGRRQLGQQESLASRLTRFSRSPPSSPGRWSPAFLPCRAPLPWRRDRWRAHRMERRGRRQRCSPASSGRWPNATRHGRRRLCPMRARDLATTAGSLSAFLATGQYLHRQRIHWCWSEPTLGAFFPVFRRRQYARCDHTVASLGVWAFHFTITAACSGLPLHQHDRRDRQSWISITDLHRDHRLRFPMGPVCREISREPGQNMPDWSVRAGFRRPCW